MSDLSSRLRVLFLYTFVGRGGDAVQVQALLEAMRRNGHSVDLVGAVPLQPYAFQKSIDGRRKLARKLPWWVLDTVEFCLNLLVGARAWARCWHHRPDLLMERMSPYNVGGVIVARLLHIPYIMHLDAPFIVERQFRQQPMFWSLHRWAMRFCGRRAAAIVVGTEVACQHYESMGLPRDRMVLLQNGVFADEVKETPAQTQGEPVIGFVGSMARWHRVDLLLDAMVLLRERGCNATLQVVGSGEDYQRMVDRVEALRLGEVVQFLGPLERKQVLSVIDRFHVGVLPNSLGTGAPMKLFEYCARGVVAVAPDLPNLRAIWGDDSVAFFPAGDVEALAGTLYHLCSQPQERKERSARGLARVREEYTWEGQMTNILRKSGVRL